MERSAKALFVESDAFRLSGFRTVGRRDVGKALVWPHECRFRKDDAEIDSNFKVL